MRIVFLLFLIIQPYLVLCQSPDINEQFKEARLYLDNAIIYYWDASDNVAHYLGVTDKFKNADVEQINKHVEEKMGFIEQGTDKLDELTKILTDLAELDEALCETARNLVIETRDESEAASSLWFKKSLLLMYATDLEEEDEIEGAMEYLKYYALAEDEVFHKLDDLTFQLIKAHSAYGQCE